MAGGPIHLVGNLVLSSQVSSPVLTGFWKPGFFGVSFWRHISFEASSSFSLFVVFK